MKKAAIIILSTSLLLSGCSADKAKAPNTSVSQKQETIYLMAGRLEAGEKADITSKISARIGDLKVNLGDSVKEGEILAILDTRDLAAQLKVSEAAYQVAQANYAKVKKGARPEQIRQTEASLASAKTNLDAAHKNFTRSKALYEAGNLSLAQLETAQSQDSAAAAQADNLQEQLAILKQGETKEGLAVIADQAEQAAAAVDVAKANLDNATITSPISGKVSAKNLSKGELASTSSVILTITNSTQPTVVSYAPPSVVGQFKVGQAVAVKISEVPGKVFSGKVTLVNSVVDPKSKGILVKVAVTDSSAELKPGMFAEIGTK